jgi:histidine kinase
MEDISRERAMEMQIHHSSRLASLGEMATGIAHELSQPLNVISTQTQLMRYKLERDGEISEDALFSAVDETMEQVFRMSDILQHLRVYGRRQAAAGYSEFTSQELLEGSLKLTQAQFKAWGIDLVVRCQEPQFKIGGKLHELQHALTNVLLNARDALREKRSALADSNSAENRQLEIQVDLRSFKREGAPWVGIDIIDNGTGIQPTALERVFDPTFTTKADGEGSGLGLPIAASIVREHGGSVRIESELDGGTSVLFEIPALNPGESNH